MDVVENLTVVANSEVSPFLLESKTGNHTSVLISGIMLHARQIVAFHFTAHFSSTFHFLVWQKV